MSPDCDPDCTESDCARGGCPGDDRLSITVAPARPLSDALADWTATARFGECDTGRYRARYAVWGQGPPLTFVHGLVDRGRSFVPVMDLLRQHFTCVSYDLPNGDDGARLAAYRHRHLVDDLLVLLDALEFRRSYLFGSSFGSTITLAALRRAPDRLPRAILQGGFARRRLVRWEHALCAFARYWSGDMATLPRRERLAHPKDAGPFQAVPSEYRTFQFDNSGSVAKRAAGWRGIMVHGVDLRCHLDRIRQPVLMICGDDDPIIDRSCEAELLAGLPNVERVELPGCGHYPQYTHAPLVAELVRRFLTPPGADHSGSACPRVSGNLNASAMPTK